MAFPRSSGFTAAASGVGPVSSKSLVGGLNGGVEPYEPLAATAAAAAAAPGENGEISLVRSLCPRGRRGKTEDGEEQELVSASADSAIAKLRRRSCKPVALREKDRFSPLDGSGPGAGWRVRLLRRSRVHDSCS